MDLMQQLLEASEKLYTHLTTIPDDQERDVFIEQINVLLDARGTVIEQIKVLESNPLHGHVLEKQLVELDQGIRERLEKVKSSIVHDMQQLQTSKKSEQRYVNPYADVRVMDGTYYDKKK